MILRVAATTTTLLSSDRHLRQPTSTAKTYATFPFATPPLPTIRFRAAASSLSSTTRRAHGATSATGIGAEQVGEEREVVKGVAEVDREAETRDGIEFDGLRVGVWSPQSVLGWTGIYRMSMGDRAFFLLAFIGCTTSIAFASLVIAAIPTLHAMKRAAISLAKLADITREELPSTMMAIRLSGMEISDLTLELSDLSQEIADGVNKSAQAVQAAEAGIKQIGSLARQRTMSMIHERANLPDISLKPVVVGAAKKTSRVVVQAKKTFMNIISQGDKIPEVSGNTSDRVET